MHSGESPVKARSTWLAWGASVRAIEQNRFFEGTGDRTKQPAANSSTMKGAKALASKAIGDGTEQRIVGAWG